MRKVELQAAGGGLAGEPGLAVRPGGEFQRPGCQAKLGTEDLAQAAVSDGVALGQRREAEARGTRMLGGGQQAGKRGALGGGDVQREEDELATGRVIRLRGNAPAPPLGRDAGRRPGQRTTQRVMPPARRGSSTGLSASVL